MTNRDTLMLPDGYKKYDIIRDDDGKPYRVMDNVVGPIWEIVRISEAEANSKNK